MREQPRRTLTHDSRHTYRGSFTEGGVCRVRVYEAAGAVPVVLVTELPENTNTSVTNMIEYLAAELLVKHFPHRLEEPEPAIVIEHYPADRAHTRPTFDQVTFGAWTPRPAWLGGVYRVALGEPDWRHLPPEEVAALIGPVDDA